MRCPATGGDTPAPGHLHTTHSAGQLAQCYNTIITGECLQSVKFESRVSPVKAHVSSVGERRWPGAGGEATPGPGRGHGTEQQQPGHLATLGDSGTLPWVEM